MSHERARRRAEREAAAAVEQSRREAHQQRTAARATRRKAVEDALPRPTRVARQRGILETRRRRRWRAAVLVVVLVQVATWLLSDSWALRVGVLGLSLLAAPVVLVLLADRRS